MDLQDLRKRLEKLNRGPLFTAEELASRERTIQERRKSYELSTLVPGRIESIEGADCYVISRRVARTWPEAADVHRRLTAAMRPPAGDAKNAPHADVLAVRDAGVDRLSFVDLETCGFAGTPVFLIGVMHVTLDDFVVDQLLARGYAEETGIIACFARRLAVRPHLVTFNGKSFDLPFVASRAAVCRVDLPDVIGHCDLLHVARRRYRELLPNCRLQTLEQFVCNRRRVGDIPGSEIPAAYHEFVRTGDARVMRDVIHHNFLDLVTMAELLADLAA